MFEQLDQIARLQQKLDRLLPQLIEVRPQLPEHLADFIPAVSRKYDPPLHLQPYMDVLESTLERPRKVVLSVPPRHFKTETTLHSFPWLWTYNPEKTHGYFSYGAEIAAEKSRAIQRYTEEVGMHVDGSVGRWYNGLGGGVIAGSVQGSVTGRGIDGLCVVDDPHKNRAEAESPTIRNRIYEGFKADILTRCEPGSSVLLIQTRWHPDDLAGRLIREGWPDLVINLPAVDNDTITGRDDGSVYMAFGKALCPSRWPLEMLQKKRWDVGEYTWSSLYQGVPRPRGSTLYSEPSYYSAVPSSGYRIVYGLDIAYTAKTSADWTVCVRLYVVGRGDTVTAYIHHVDRWQLEAPKTGALLQARLKEAPGPIWWHGSGTEKGSAQLFNSSYLGGKLVMKQTSLDKFTRALDSSAAWNSGRILVPRKAPWLPPFLDVVQGFTGIADDFDDDVDALGSGWAAGQSLASSSSYMQLRDIPLPGMRV